MEDKTYPAKLVEKTEIEGGYKYTYLILSRGVGEDVTEVYGVINDYLVVIEYILGEKSYFSLFVATEFEDGLVSVPSNYMSVEHTSAKDFLEEFSNVRIPVLN